MKHHNDINEEEEHHSINHSKIVDSKQLEFQVDRLEDYFDRNELTDGEAMLIVSEYLELLRARTAFRVMKNYLEG